MKKIILFLALFVTLLNSCSNEIPEEGYHIGIDPNWYSLELMGREKNVQGFIIDVLREIDQEEKLKISLVTRTADNLYQGLSEKKYEAVFSATPPYPFLLEKYDFSELLLPTGPALVVPADSKIHSLDMLHGKMVAIQRGVKSEILLETHGDIAVKVYDSIPQALNDILKGTVDGAIIDILTAQAYCEDLYQGQLKVATGPLNNVGIRLVTLHKEHEGLMRKFNEGMKMLHSKGKYTELRKKWSLDG